MSEHDRPQHYTIENNKVVIVYPDPENETRTLYPLPDNFWIDGLQTKDWNYDTGDWEDRLDFWYERRWNEAKIARDTMIYGGTTVSGLGRVQTDSESRMAIDQKFLLALSNPSEFSDTWIMEDNSLQPVEYTEMQAIKISVEELRDEARLRAEDIRQQLNAARLNGDLEALLAVERF